MMEVGSPEYVPQHLFALGYVMNAAWDKLDKVKAVASVIGSAPKELRKMCKTRSDKSKTRCGGQCAICLDELNASAWQQELPCGHTFHAICVHPWLSLSESCPVCRRSCRLGEALSHGL